VVLRVSERKKKKVVLQHNQRRQRDGETVKWPQDENNVSIMSIAPG
jgi:hypothetical protein